MVIAGHQRLDTLASYIFRLAFRFSFWTDLGIVHTGTMEKFGVCCARLQGSDGDSGIAQFVTQAMGKGKHKRFTGGINCFPRRYHLACDRGGDQYLSLTLPSHVLDHLFRQMDSTATIQPYHVHFSLEVGFGTVHQPRRLH